MTHDQLVRRACGWLARRYPVVICEMASGRETPDAIGFDHQGKTTLIECKTSRRDFQADRDKFVRKFGRLGMGTERYYLSDPDVIRATDVLPDGWGLLHVVGRSIRLVKYGFPNQKDAGAELSLLLSLIRRSIKPGPGISVKVYVIGTKNRATAVVERQD